MSIEDTYTDNKIDFCAINYLQASDIYHKTGYEIYKFSSYVFETLLISSNPKIIYL